MSPRDPSYRWVVLGVGVVAQGATAAVLQGLPGLAPELRTEYGLGLTGLGVVLGTVTVGLVSTLLLWGAAADRFGERRVMTGGLLAAALWCLLAARATSLGQLLVFLLLAGMSGASVNAASGRAVLGWFGPQERGFAMGVRQTALPLGAGIAAAVLPPVASRHGLAAAFDLMALGCLVGAVGVAIWVREAPAQQVREVDGPSPLRDRRVRRLSGVSGLLVVPQFAVVAFVVVYLSDEHGLSVPTAALLLAGVQFAGGAGRIVAGRMADRRGLRLVPLRAIALVVAGLFSLLAVLSPYSIAVPLVLVAGVTAISWNGLAFTAAGEFAGPGRAGAALGLQNTAVAIGAALTAPVLGAVVEHSSWTAAYAVAAACALAAALVVTPLVRAERPHQVADSGEALAD